jgi:uncharacterized protein YeaO (DUF488 family)
MLKTKSIKSPIEKSDGLRILATRFRGRFVPTSRYDVWMPSLGPSEGLLKSSLRWSQFIGRYKKELFADSEVDRRNTTIKNRGQKSTLRLIKHLAKKQNVTLLCHCVENTRHCHRHTLKKVILSAKV